jgi:hypothetical protein
VNSGINKNARQDICREGIPLSAALPGITRALPEGGDGPDYLRGKSWRSKARMTSRAMNNAWRLVYIQSHGMRLALCVEHRICSGLIKHSFKNKKLQCKNECFVILDFWPKPSFISCSVRVHLKRKTACFIY